MAIDLYRRHSPDCKHSSKGQNFTKCSCPIWCYGTLNARPVRQSLKTRDWTIALRAIAGMEAEPQKPVQILTVAAAIKEYLEDCAARHLAPSTITSYRNVLVPFGQYCENRNLREVRGLRLDEFRGFRAYREVSVKTQRKEIEHLRAFCAFCVQHGWLKENYGKLVRMPE